MTTGLLILFAVIFAFIAGIWVGFMSGFKAGYAKGVKEYRTGTSITIHPYMGWIFAICGMVCLLIASVFAIKTMVFKHQSAIAKGSVIEMKWNVAKDNKSSNASPRFVFKDSAGSLHTNQSKTATYPPLFAVGDAVTVLYDPAELGNAKIDSTLELWGISLLTGGLGAFFGLIGVFILKLPRIKAIFQKSPTQPLHA